MGYVYKSVVFRNPPELLYDTVIVNSPNHIALPSLPPADDCFIDELKAYINVYDERPFRSI